jgi:hypothetical protein
MVLAGGERLEGGRRMTSLSGVLPELVIAHDQLVQALADQGISTRIANYGALRSQADTTQILTYRTNDYNHDVAAGIISPTLDINTYRPIAPFGSSYHNYGAAFDLEVTGAPPGVSAYHALAIAGELAPSFGLRWGGTFPIDRRDTPHFELAIPLSEARRRYNEFTVDAGPGLPDLSALLGLGPELTPGDAPDFGDAAGDDSGDAALVTLPPQSNVDAFVLAGAIALAAVVWAIRRRFL